MKVLICGSRKINNMAILASAIRESGFVISEIISGGAEGVDYLAEQYAALAKIPIRIFRPEYQKYHAKQAPLIRNEVMVKECEAVIAIWDGISRGTDYTIRCARKYKRPIYIWTKTHE